MSCTVLMVSSPLLEPMRIPPRMPPVVLAISPPETSVSAPVPVICTPVDAGEIQRVHGSGGSAVRLGSAGLGVGGCAGDEACQVAGHVTGVGFDGRSPAEGGEVAAIVVGVAAKDPVGKCGRSGELHLGAVARKSTVAPMVWGCREGWRTASRADSCPSGKSP